MPSGRLLHSDQCGLTAQALRLLAWPLHSAAPWRNGLQPRQRIGTAGFGLAWLDKVKERPLLYLVWVTEQVASEFY